MLRSFIKLFFFLGIIIGQAQEPTPENSASDSLENKEAYGLRAGIDLSRPLLSVLNDNYTGFEIVADYRLTQNLYIAGELGNEEKTQFEELGNEFSVNIAELYNFTTKGSYLKLGVDFNTYENWYGMNNTIFVGGRYAFSTLTQTVNNNRIYDSNRYWNTGNLASGTTGPVEYSGLNASWIEFLFGLKAELFANIYLGASVRLAYLISNKEADNFPNLWIPGFNKVTEGSKFGVGYNYSLTYFLPLYKKRKSPKPTNSSQ